MAKSSLSSARPNGVLYVEVQLTQSSHGGPKTAKIKDEVGKYLRRNYTEIQIGTLAMDANLPSVIQRIEIADYSKSKEFPDKSYHVLAEIELEIAVYSLNSERDLATQDWDDVDGKEGEEGEQSHFTAIALPHETLDRLWQSLVYKEPVGELIFRALTRSIKEQNAQTQPYTARANNTILLHGPPGSGKTSLAQALAQRISIRLSDIYPRTELLEIASDALLSRFFGESSKTVGKLFKKIVDMANTDMSRLLVVLFDEVESIAGCREQALKSSEVADAHRVAVQMLRGLDAIRKCHNVIFICTTNFISNIDSAFVDRIFLREAIHVPAIHSIYEILRGELNNLIQNGQIASVTMVYDDASGHGRAEAAPLTEFLGPRCHSSSSMGTADGVSAMPMLVPDLHWATVHWAGYPFTASTELYQIAQRAQGLSGRRLRDLIEQSRLKYTVDTPCDLREFLLALDRVVEQDRHAFEPMPECIPYEETQQAAVEKESEAIAALLARVENERVMSTVDC